MLFFPRRTDKMLPKSRFSKPIFGHSAGSTKLDRPYCKRFWFSVLLIQLSSMTTCFAAVSRMRRTVSLVHTHQLEEKVAAASLRRAPPVSTRKSNEGLSCESWLAFLILELWNPAVISCGFLPCAPTKTAFFCRKLHFSAGKRIFYCRKAHISVGKCILLRENAFFWRKTHSSAVCSGGLRIMHGSLFLDEVGGSSRELGLSRRLQCETWRRYALGGSRFSWKTLCQRGHASLWNKSLKLNNASE